MLVTIPMSLILACTVQASNINTICKYNNDEIEENLNEITEILNLNTDLNTKQSYTEEDVDLLAHLINAEMGCSWFSDDLLLYAGSVVLNRIEHTNYKNNLHDVIYEDGQYQCTWNGAIKKEPSERHYKIAKELLENGSVIPENVIYQAEFKQGSDVFYEYYDKVLNTTIYFCYE